MIVESKQEQELEEQEQERTKPIKILLVGSNFLSSHILVRLLSFDNVHVVVMDRKDPTTIINYNQDTYRIFRQYCKDLKYRDLYDEKTFGDQKRNIKLSFMFKDYVNEPSYIHDSTDDVDIVIYTGAIYDTLYAKNNATSTLDVNVLGLHNLIENTYYNHSDDSRALFIHLSSVNVYGDQTNRMEDEITEDKSIPNPQDVLNLSLYTQENMVKALIHPHENDIDYMILRLGTLCGEFTPRDSLVTSAIAALLQQKKEFDIYNGQNGIELLDINDLGMTINSIISLYRNGGPEYEKIVNQVYNIKSEESDPKTVEGVVKAIYATGTKLPTITKDHGIKGIDGFKLRAPKIKNADLWVDRKPLIKFDKPISITKAKELLKFVTMKPLVQTMLPVTVNYLLNYVLTEFSDEVRRAFTKMFYLPSTPTPETVDDNVHNDVQELIKDVNDTIEKAFE